MTRRRKTGRLRALRAAMARLRLDAFLVPPTDEHQQFSVPAQSRRLEWLTGFTGDYGYAVVTADTTLLFARAWSTWSCAADEFEAGEPFELVKLGFDDAMPLADWLRSNLPPTAAVGFDPWLHAQAEIEALEAERGGTFRLVRVDANPIDARWLDRPVPLGRVEPYPDAQAGAASAAKRAEVGAALRASGADAALLCRSDSIAWLLNIRGADLPYAPVPLAFAILHADGAAELFLRGNAGLAAARQIVGADVAVGSGDAFLPRVRALADAGRRLQVDPATTPVAVFEAAGDVQRAPDPTFLPRACKRPSERAAMRHAHFRDGLALANFFAWFDEAAPKGAVTEGGAAAAVDRARAAQPAFWGPSFETISAAQGNAAILIYAPRAGKGRRIEPGNLFLLDSGGQYSDGGTTDVTRTWAVGPGPYDPEIVDRYTRVLRGLIALSAARFPPGTSGSALDPLARGPLWEIGLDYDSLTGHGVGCFNEYLETLPAISRPSGAPIVDLAGLPTDLRPGMAVTVEPGFYRPGVYGIRLENVLEVVDLGPGAGGRHIHGFETLTLAPFDRRLIDAAALDTRERAWIDAYHARVAETLLPHLDAAPAAWLVAATRPL